MELLIIVFVSIAGWWLFEFYNVPRFWINDRELWWHYHNLEPNPYLRRVGYDWAFATIFPAMFLSARFLLATLFKSGRGFRPIQFSKPWLYVLVALGAVGSLVPLIVVSDWLAPVVWLSLLLLLDPINYFRGWPSIVGDLRVGNYQRLLALLAGGGLCGVLWEFWNYWAISKWTYTVPYFGNIKILKCPCLAFLDFHRSRLNAGSCTSSFARCLPGSLCKQKLSGSSRVNDASLWKRDENVSSQWRLCS